MDEADRSRRHEPNPSLFRELSVPVPDAELQTALMEFYKGVGELREKHRIANVYCVVNGAMLTTEGEESEYMTSFQYGDMLRGQSMVAWAYGYEQAAREETLGEVMRLGKKRGRSKE